MKRVLILCGMVLALGALPPAAARADIGPCTGTRVAYVSLKVANEPLVSSDGTTWATATYTRAIVVYRVNSGAFCAMTQDSGSFTTTGGTSPGGTATLPAGLTGTISRSTHASFTAGWSPRFATSGFIGIFYGTASWTDDWTSLFFTDVSSFELTWEGVIFQLSGHGCFAFRLDLGLYRDLT
jgi:hypothetical protein